MSTIRIAIVISWTAALMATSLSGCLLDNRDARYSAQASGDLCAISTAVFSYHDKYGHLPPAYILGLDGKPAHSWRVLLLEFLDQKDLLKQYNFNEPWNGPNNRKLADKMPSQYRVASDPAARGQLTSFVVLAGPQTAFPGDKAIKLNDITDGSGNTILIAEAEGFNIHWMEPRDWDVAVFGIAMSEVTKPGFSSHNRRYGPHIALADGARIRLDRSAPVDQLVGMSTIAGGEKVNLKLVEGEVVEREKEKASQADPREHTTIPPRGLRAVANRFILPNRCLAGNQPVAPTVSADLPPP